MEDNDYSLGLETGNPAASLIPQITMESLGYLNTAAKWAKFLAILGFIGVGILVLLDCSWVLFLVLLIIYPLWRISLFRYIGWDCFISFLLQSMFSRLST